MGKVVFYKRIWQDELAQHLADGWEHDGRFDWIPSCFKYVCIVSRRETAKEVRERLEFKKLTPEQEESNLEDLDLLRR